MNDYDDCGMPDPSTHTACEHPESCIQCNWRQFLDNMLLLYGEHHRGLHDGEFSITALGRQRFRSHGPGGATYAAAPETRGSARALVEAHADIAPDAIEPNWLGDKLDLDWAVMTLVPPTSGASVVPPPAPAA